MALNKLQSGTSFSSQIPGQNHNWTQLEEIVSIVKDGTIIGYAGEVSINLTNFAYSCENNTKFYTSGTVDVGLPEGISNYGIGFVLSRTKDMSGSNFRWIVYFDIMGRVAIRTRNAGEWNPWKTYGV